MGMRIRFARSPVGSPSCMTYTAVSNKGSSLIRLLYQIVKFSYCLDNLSRITSVPYSYSCRIIAAVFKLGQSLKKYGCRLSVPDITNYSAHTLISFVIINRTLLYKNDLHFQMCKSFAVHSQVIPVVPKVNLSYPLYPISSASFFSITTTASL